MYVPPPNRIDDEAEIHRLVAAVGAAELVAATDADGYPLATRLPVLWDVEQQRLVFHMAIANPHWRAIEETGAEVPALAVVTGPQAYVSPGWYASKAEHGRVVPTWNYSAVHVSGHVTVHHDPAWLRDAVTRLTDHHEQPRAQPWEVTDAPAAYVEGQLRAIVGIELAIARVEGKAKLSQNRSAADVAGVVTGLRDEGGPEAGLLAEEMQRNGLG